MFTSKSVSPGGRSPSNLSNRELILVPIVSLLTVAACLLCSELVSRHFFAHQDTDFCRMDDSNIGYRYRPNCIVHLKTAEGPWVINKYNECGYRTLESCGPKRPATTRIVLLGASVSEGLYIPYDQTFAEKTAHGLAELLRRPVEIQNLGRANASPISVFHQLDEALSLRPNLMILVIDPYDIEHIDLDQLADRYEPIPPLHNASGTPSELKRQPLKRLEIAVKESSMATAATHFLFQNTETFVRVYLRYGDHADYLSQAACPYLAAAS